MTDVGFYVGTDNQIHVTNYNLAKQYITGNYLLGNSGITVNELYNNPTKYSPLYSAWDKPAEYSWTWSNFLNNIGKPEYSIGGTAYDLLIGNTPTKLSSGLETLGTGVGKTAGNIISETGAGVGKGVSSVGSGAGNAVSDIISKNIIPIVIIGVLALGGILLLNNPRIIKGAK